MSSIVHVLPEFKIILLKVRGAGNLFPDIKIKNKIRKDTKIKHKKLNEWIDLMKIESIFNVINLEFFEWSRDKIEINIFRYIKYSEDSPEFIKYLSELTCFK